MKHFIPVSFFRQIGNFIRTNEKLLLAVLALVIIVTGGIWYRQHFSADGPVSGGTYVDGIVGGIEELDAVAAKLTKVGFFVIDDEGRLQNQLVEDWSVNDDNTRYRFDLFPAVSGEDVVEDINKNLELFGPADVRYEGDGVVVISLTEPNPNIPILLLQPLFDYGPYKLSKMSNTTAIFTRNTHPNSANTFINKIVVHAFADEDALKEALRRKRIDGAYLSEPQDFDGYSRFSYSTPNYYSVIFNVNRSPFRDQAFRQRVVSGEAASGSVTLTVANEQPLLGLAEQVKTSWESQGLSVTLDVRSTSDIALRVGPSRDFQALLTGISYAPELDPLYLWHSSQIRPPGNNLSGLRDDKVDQLINDIGSDYSIFSRYEKIEELHQYLVSIGAMQIVEAVKQEFLISRNVVAVEPYLPMSIRDRWQSIGRWYLR